MEFFTLLRSLRDRAKYRFSVVFSLDRPLEETVRALLSGRFQRLYQRTCDLSSAS